MKKFGLMAIVPLFVIVSAMTLKKTTPAVDIRPVSFFGDKKVTVVQKPKVRFRWRGVFGPNNTCDRSGRECGDCPGICVIIEFRSGSISDTEKADGDGYANVAMDHDHLLFAPEADIDNGDGTVTITEDYPIGAEYSNLLGYKNITILAGTYSIDYTKGLGYGYVEFPTRAE
jgi:hypothetical protein